MEGLEGVKALKKPKKWIKSITSKLSKNKYLKKVHNKPLLFAGLFAAIAVLALVLVKAAPFTANREAENSSISGNVATTSGAGASNGSYLTFGANSQTGTCADGPNFTSWNICINPASIPAAVTGETQNRLRQNSSPGSYPISTGDVSSFRLDCSYSHINKDDPIVYPGQQNAAHWHMFFGNTAANYSMTNTRTQGNSTCEGGAANKTAYWAPILIDTNSYNSTTKQFNLAQPMNGPYMKSMQVYYKSGYWGPRPETIQPFPPGLRMIAGASSSIEPTAPHPRLVADQPYVWFDCVSSGNTQDVYNGIHKRTQVPTDCPPGRYIQANIHFPQCGARNPDGSPVLDSPDHRSHMAYGRGYLQSCPASHPIAYPEVLEHFRWQVPSTGASGLRFSSDIWPNRPAGWTFHADWWNGWDENVLQQTLNHCYYITPRDCGTGGDSTLYPHPNGGFYSLDYPRNSNWQ